MLKGICKFFVILTLLSAAIVYLLFGPTYVSSLSYHNQSIIITRDSYNIPNIQAESRKSFLYGWGYAIAEDRLFQMAFKQIFIEGRLAEFLGERALDIDRFMREINLKYWANRTEQRLQKQDAQGFCQLASFIEGINDCANKKIVLPLDFQLLGLKWQNWTVGNMLAMHKLVQWTQAMNMPEEYFRTALLSNYTKEQIAKFMPNTDDLIAFKSKTIVKDEDIPSQLRTNFSQIKEKLHFQPSKFSVIEELGLFPYLASLDGSNSWAISGNYTQSGQPILSYDPHLENSIPSQWYQIRGSYLINSTNRKFSGVSIPGVPLMLGKTDYFASSFTTIQYDNQDLYKQQVQDGKYLVDGKWHNLKIRKEKILVKTSQGLQQQIYTVRETHRGPLIHYIFSSQGSFKINDDVSMIWTGFHDDHASFVAISRLNEITDLQTLKRQLKYSSKYFCNFNVVCITRDNHILYQELGIFPIRRDESTGMYIKDGTTSENDWIGIMPPEHRLQVVDPKCGYIITANNKIASSQYYNGYLNYTFYTARANRIEQIVQQQIKTNRKFTIQFVKRMITDTVDIYCTQILPQILAALPEAQMLLKDYDCDFSEFSYGSTIYQVFIYELHHLIKPHRTENFSALSFYTYQQYLYNYIHQAHAGNSQKKEIMKKAWEKMQKTLSNFYQTKQHTEWKWGKFHLDTSNHFPFSKSPLKIIYNRQFQGRGNMNTINMGKMSQEQLANFQVTTRPNYRVIYTYSGKSWWIIDGGSSQSPLSRHYDDQWEKFRRNSWIQMDLPNDQPQSDL